MKRFERILPGGATPVHMPEPVSKYEMQTNYRFIVDRDGRMQKIDTGGARKVLVSLPKVKGYYDARP